MINIMKKLKLISIFLLFIIITFIITYSVFGEDVNNNELINSVAEGEINSLEEQKNELTNKIEEANEQLTEVQNSISTVQDSWKI